jgi:hypothetical protein
LRPDQAKEKLEGNAGQAELVGYDLVWASPALRHLLRWSRIKPDAGQKVKRLVFKAISASSAMNMGASSY